MRLENVSKLVSVSYLKEYDLLNQQEVLEISLKVDTGAIRQGFIKEIGATNFSVLMAIASFMNEKGECFPTQRQIAEIVGMSLTTVNKAVAELLKVEVNGQPIIERRLVGDGVRKNSFYNFVQLSTEELKSIQEGAPKEKRAVDYIRQFCELFVEEFGIEYVPNYGRDVKLINDRLISKYSEDMITEVFTRAVRQYKRRWYSPKYKTPSMIAVTSWIANDVLADLAKEREQDVAIAQQQSCTSSVNDLEYLL